jgi:CheY-like chemotaxis protein
MFRVLVVEDEFDLRSLLAKVLAEFGYDVATAADGVEAIRIIQTQPPDILLLDLVMPGMDGWAFLESAEQSSLLDGMPIGIFSAVTAAHAAVPKRANCMIAKPFDLDELLAAVDDLAAQVEPRLVGAA